MAEEYKIELGIGLNDADFNNVKSKIKTLENDDIKIKLNDSIIDTQINNLKTKLKGLGGVDIDLSANIKFDGNNAVRAAQQTGKKIGDSVTKSVKQSLNIDDVIDKQVLDLMKSYGIAGKKGSKAFNDIRQAVVEYRRELQLTDNINTNSNDIFDVIGSSSGIKKVTSTLASHIKIADEAKNTYKDLAEYIRSINKNGGKIHLPDTIRQEYGDDFSRMRSSLGSAFTTGNGVDFESFIVELNSQLGETIDLSHGAEVAFGDLVNKVNSTKGSKNLLGDELFSRGYLNFDDVSNDIISAISVIDTAENRIAQTSTSTTNTIVQNEERKIQAKQRAEQYIQQANQRIKEIDEEIENNNKAISDLGRNDIGLDVEQTAAIMQNYMNRLDELDREKAELLANIKSIESALKGEAKQATETANAYDKISKSTSLVRDDANFQKVFDESNQAAQEAQKHFQELLADEKAIVSVTEQFDDSNALQSFVVNVKRASGEVETLRYSLKNLAQEEDEEDDWRFTYNGASANDKNVEKQLDKHIKKANDLQIKLDKIKSGYNDVNAAKPIKKSDHISSLDEQYKKVERAITDVRNADDATFSSMVSNAEREQAALENMVREYRNAETVATSLRSKDISTVKDTYSSKLDVLISKMRKDGVYTSGFESGAENLRSILSSSTDASGLVKFLNGLDKLEAGYKRASASAKEFNQTQKVGINVSGLKSKIADLQRISPEIDKFETEIDGAKVSVQSLLNDLGQVKTQGDITVVNAKWRAFTDAAKSAGIAVTDTVAKMKSADDIKLDFDLGKYDNQISQMRDKFDRLSSASKELRESIDQVENAYREMELAAGTGDEIADRERLVQVEKELADALTKTNNLLKIQAREERAVADAQKLQDRREKFQEKIDAWLVKNSAATKKFGAELLDLRAKAEYADQADLDHLESELYKIDKRAEQAGLKMQSLGDKIKSKAKEYMAYFSVAEIFMEIAQAMRRMFDTVLEIDTAMTGLYRVTDLTSAQYDELFNDMISSAKEYGATLTDIINATTDWVRAGFDANTALGLAEVTTMYQHISDLDYDTAAENLITAYNGFKDELNGAFDGDQVAAVEYIADIFNELDKQNCPQGTISVKG